MAVVPGEAFGPPGYLRLSYALGDDDLAEGVGRLQKLLGTGGRRLSVDGSAGCYSCAQEAADDVAPHERLLVTEHWRVAHAFDSSLPGWLVVLPRRHLLSLVELERAAG